jgi:hypothetical protein
MDGRKRLATMALIVMLGGAALAFAASPGATGSGGSDVFRGYLDTRDAAGPRLFTLRIVAHTDAADARRLEAALVEGGQEAMFARLGAMRPAGWLQLDRDTGFPVAVVNERRVDGERQVVALVNRPIGFGEHFWGARSTDYPFALVVITVDEFGEGRGTFVPAARARLDSEGRVSFLDYGAIPYRIMRVRTDES